MSIEVLDPRFDAEPPYWRELRARAGLRADWAWEVLRQQAWCARTPWALAVLLDGSRPRGMVGAAWVGSRTRRHRFVVSRRGGGIGGLDLRAPGSSSFPSWWFADAGTDGGVRRLLSEYLPAMRRLFGPGLKGALIRQLPEAAVPAVAGRWRWVRETEPIARIDTEAFGCRDDWLETVSRRRRAHLRKVFAQVEGDEGLAVEFLRGEQADAVEVAELLRINEVKHRDVPIVPLPQFVGYLRRLLAQPDVFVLSYRDVETRRLLGATTVYDHPQWPLARSWSAVEVEDGGRPDLYFHMYGELVRWAISEGKRGVVLGKKMIQVKTSLGAELTPQYAAAIPLR
ncbi:hypothetical protein [Saccharomonospora viridis]|jgi:hypothetical protein|uniref:BioF2-like acetyltransferase domain-containing protein n=2 Tax=Saccharomonospora viridis TaxID=1852 RepID=C7MR95_SACVD|nr:hypothetical protein [Saccharomonospora viridis]ACU98681.1 hypothetical protein Svir_37360 [Saccharomonospora viridis DSM 43017]SFP65381.1 hypothetical protein SAMN02982918_3029 [Saccharomonospora viridis]